MFSPGLEVLYPMLSIWIFLQVIMLVLGPMLVRQAVRRFRLIRWLGPVLGCYGLGVLFRASGVWPLETSTFEETAKSVAGVAVLTAIPMLLYTTDFMAWLRFARRSVLAFAVICMCIVTSAGVVGLTLGEGLPESWKVSGMLVGTFTGGTPNFASIGLAVEVTDEVFAIATATEVFVSLLYLLFLLRGAQAVFGRFLPAFALPDVKSSPPSTWTSNRERSVVPWRWVWVAGLTVGVVLASVLLAQLLQALYRSWGTADTVVQELFFPLTIIGVTTFSLALSFWPRVRQLGNLEPASDYIVLIFCVSFGSLIDLGQFHVGNFGYMLFTALIVVMALVLYYFCCWLLQIDTDTAIIVSTAALFSPPFIGMVCESLDNRRIFLSGLTTSIAGYAVGNYLGLGLAWLLKAWTA